MVTTTEQASQRVPLIRGLVDFVVYSGKLTLLTSEAPAFVDVTEQVQELVKESEAALGIVVIYSRHTTAAVAIQERESLLMRDMASFLERLAPRDSYYGHNDFSVRTENMNPDESPNGHSHCLHLLLGSNQLAPVLEGRMALGAWQRIFLVELDSPRERELVVQVYGLTGVQGAPRRTREG